jgi:hypothetical protein
MRLVEIEAELEKLRQEEEALDDKLLQRKKQFHLLIHTIHQVFNALFVKYWWKYTFLEVNPPPINSIPTGALKLGKNIRQTL